MTRIFSTDRVTEGPLPIFIRVRYCSGIQMSDSSGVGTVVGSKGLTLPVVMLQTGWSVLSSCRNICLVCIPELSGIPKESAAESRHRKSMQEALYRKLKMVNNAERHGNEQHQSRYFKALKFSSFELAGNTSGFILPNLRRTDALEISQNSRNFLGAEASVENSKSTHGPLHCSHSHILLQTPGLFFLCFKNCYYM